MREEHGEPNIIEVRQIFNDSLQARDWEEKVIRRMNAVKDSRWLNKNPGNGRFYCAGHSEETRKKISEKISKKLRKKNTKKKILSKEHRQKISESMTGKKRGPRSEQTKQKISYTKTGKKRGPHSKEHREKIAAALKARNIIVQQQFFQ